MEPGTYNAREFYQKELAWLPVLPEHMADILPDYNEIAADIAEQRASIEAKIASCGPDDLVRVETTKFTRTFVHGRPR